MAGIIPEKLDKKVREEAEKSGYQVVDISSRGGKGSFFEITLDKEGGITLDECGDFNRNISSWADGENIFRGGYTIDVCSPGLDRTLRSRDEFSWAKGKQVDVTTHEPLEGSSLTVGKLLEGNLEQGIILERENGKKIDIERQNIAKARVHAVIRTKADQRTERTR